MKTNWKLNWFNWIPILGSLFFLILFYCLLYKYSAAYKNGQTAIHKEEMLSWYKFFTGVGYIALFILIFGSFFIKNKWLKWISMAIGITTLSVVFFNVIKFNPF